MNQRKINNIVVSVIFIIFLFLKPNYLTVKNEINAAIVSLLIFMIILITEYSKNEFTEIIKHIVGCVAVMSITMLLKDAFAYIHENQETFRVLLNDFLNSK